MSYQNSNILGSYNLPLAALIISSSAAIISTPAYAQDSIFTIPSPQNESYADVGVAGVTRDTYVGSGKSENLILPFVNAEYKGRAFFKPGLGAGLYAAKNKNFRVSASANLALGRDTEDTPFREQGFDKELLEVDTTLTVALAGRYYLPFGAVDVLGSIPIGGDLDGHRVDAIFTTEIKPLKNLRLTPGVRATYQSSGWINSIYGVNNTQAATLGVDAFETGAQFSTVGAHAVGYYQLPHNFEIVGVVNYSRLIGNVKNSPLAASRTGLTAAIGIAKQF